MQLSFVDGKVGRMLNRIEGEVQSTEHAYIMFLLCILSEIRTILHEVRQSKMKCFAATAHMVASINMPIEQVLKQHNDDGQFISEARATMHNAKQEIDMMFAMADAKRKKVRSNVMRNLGRERLNNFENGVWKDFFEILDSLQDVGVDKERKKRIRDNLRLIVNASLTSSSTIEDVASGFNRVRDSLSGSWGPDGYFMKNRLYQVSYKVVECNVDLIRGLVKNDLDNLKVDAAVPFYRLRGLLDVLDVLRLIPTAPPAEEDADVTQIGTIIKWIGNVLWFLGTIIESVSTSKSHSK